MVTRLRGLTFLGGNPKRFRLPKIETGAMSIPLRLKQTGYGQSSDPTNLRVPLAFCACGHRSVVRQARHLSVVAPRSLTSVRIISTAWGTAA
jgi:hypothetical protein